VYVTGKHPFLNANGILNYKKFLNGDYEKVEKGKYSDELIALMERMISVVWVG
jgi:hypothetical protein